MLMERDMSAILGWFSPFQLVYFANLSVLNLSECTNVEGPELVDCIQACGNLRKISLRGCNKIHEHYLAEILISLKMLHYVDCTDATSVVYLIAYCMVSSLKHLKFISLMPKYPNEELHSWKWLKIYFSHISFGKPITEMLGKVANSV